MIGKCRWHNGFVGCQTKNVLDVSPNVGGVAVLVDHMLHIPAARGVGDKNFQSLLRLVGEGHVHVKVSAAYRLSDRFPDYPDARPFHEALLRANPQRLLWGTDWPHPSIPGEVMPDDGHLFDCSGNGRRTNRRGVAFSPKPRRACSGTRCHTRVAFFRLYN
jgi:hypothetical protein